MFYYILRGAKNPKRDGMTKWYSHVGTIGRVGQKLFAIPESVQKTSAVALSNASSTKIHPTFFKREKYKDIGVQPRDLNVPVGRIHKQEGRLGGLKATNVENFIQLCVNYRLSLTQVLT
ncbi:hypothetical protein T265_05676 [Opisthorchis viverrini]|uniref:Uncharacterized protein n=1 Tax=Opisthorchis viverrini TaxID=6198 RepID=A0A074ZIW7_OPIVI|nr:hypothetical protein T265_05676 [Opisthorchis viverrini]KER27273.1 hypothetical protein T265_05676 [Opisthorchis viverrini]